MPLTNNERRKFEEILLLESVNHSVQKTQLQKNLMLTYVVIFIGFLGFIIAQSILPDAKKDITTAQVARMESDINSLKKSLDELSKAEIDSATAVKIDSLENSVSNISATILEDPDKALTARLLREKQINLEASVKDLKAETETTRQWFISLIFAILAAPLVGSFFTFATNRSSRSKNNESTVQSSNND